MNDRHTGQTYYEILELPTTAGPTDIYNAYQRARSTYSPNSPALYSMFSPDEAQALMALIEEAYQTLSHQGRRRDYDIKIGLQTQPLKSAQPTRPSNSVAKPVEDQWVGKVRMTPPRREELPKGFARTKFSVYEINPQMEEEIKSVEDWNGKWLQKVRLYKGITLDHLVDEIRVIKSTLVAFESDDIEALPVAVFTRGFVVQMARVYGLDERKVTDSYMKFFKAKKSES